MPKIKKHERAQYGLEEHSEDYDPTYAELENDRRIKNNIFSELYSIEDVLDHPDKDPYTGEKDRYRAIDPEDMGDSLAYLKKDYLGKIKDPEIRQEVREYIGGVEKKLYLQYLPFISAKINIFGLINSPLERKIGKRKMTVEEVEEIIKRAEEFFGRCNLTDDERTAFASQLENLKKRFEKYQTEPTLFTFDKIEENLIEKLIELQYGYRLVAQVNISLDNQSAREKNLKKYDELIENSRKLAEIATAMTDKEIKLFCEERAERAEKWIVQEKLRFEAPRQLATLEAKIKDAIDRAKDGKKISDDEIARLKEDLENITNVGGKFYVLMEKLTKMLKILERLRKGGDPREAFFEEKYEDPDWAWDCLGLDRDADEEDVKKAYIALAIKYHPDKNTKDEKAKEKMQIINEAYELIKRGFEKRQNIDFN